MATSRKGTVVPAGKKLIFVSRITRKDGKVIYARQYGYRAFPIVVPE